MNKSAAKPRIEVETLSEGDYRVRVIEGGSESAHRVTLKAEDFKRLAGGKVAAEELVRRSFEFLLEREPKESILARFDLSVIARYFPEYENEIARRL
ncbi:MAG: hypothetical protein WBF06_01375 [Candidatus Acidiferrales bacterium]